MRQVKVTGTYVEPDGDPAQMLVSFTPTSTLKNIDENLIILERSIQAMTNARGYFEVLLYPWQDGMQPAEFLYDVAEYRDREMVNHWYLRLDEETPDEIAITSVYPAAASVSQEVYPTLAEVRAIAADLDSAVYKEVDEVETSMVTLTASMATKVGLEEVGITIPDMVNGKIQTKYIPTLYIAESFPASSQSQMLATANRSLGTICRRTDLGLSYILEGEDSTNITAWVPLSDNFSVTSVNGKAGMVVLAPADIGAARAEHNHEILSGREFVATFMRSSLDTTATLEVTQGAEMIRVTDKRISFLDSSKTEFYALDPYQALQWVALTLQPLDANSAALTGASYDAKTRTIITGLVQFALDFQLGVIVEFGYPDVGVVLPPYIGSWVATTANGEPVPYANHLSPSSGIVTGTTDHRIVFGGLREFLSWRSTVYPGVQHFLHARGNLA